MKIKQKIDEKNRWMIEVIEEIQLEKMREKPSLKLYFQNEREDRLFPLETSFVEVESDKFMMIGKNTILLPYVFLNETRGDKVIVSVEIYYKGRREVTGEILNLDSKFFQKPPSRDCRKLIIIRWIFAFIMIPFATLHSLFAKNKGKMIIVKANQLIKRCTGISFSIREFKTDYLKKQYKRNLVLPVKANNVLFLSEREVEKGGNLSLIYDELRKNDKLLITLFLKTRTVDRLSFRELKDSARLMAEARFIILEDFYPQLHALELRKETKVIQLWHACGAFKTFGFSRLHKPGGPEEESKNHRNYDRVFVSGEKMIPYYSEAFAIPQKNILPFGTPRTDIFFNEGYKEKIQMELFNQFPVFKYKKVILFAPTFRGSGNKDAFYPDSAFSVKEFMKKMPKDIILIIKQHPFVKESPFIPLEYKDRVFDFSKKISINKLLFITKLLITDYSSSIFEASLLNIPMLFYVFDEDNYRKERDFYGDFDSFIPGVKVKSMDELKKAIWKFLDDEQSFIYDMAEFKNTYLSAIDGNSTKKITDYLLNLMEGEIE